MVAKELEPDLQKDMITWGSNINIISIPHFITSTQPHSSGTDCLKQTSYSKSKKKKVKTISTQTESPATSRPGVRYMERSPSQELVDSFSSLSSVDHNPVPPTIKTITMETTKHNLMKNKDATTNKHHKKKRKHVTSSTPYVASDITLTTQDITQDTHPTNPPHHPFKHTRESHSSVIHDTSIPASQTSLTSTPVKSTYQSILTREIVTQASYTSTPLTQASYTSTPVKCNDIQLGREVLPYPIVSHASYTNTPLAQISYDSIPVHYNTPQHSREVSSLQQPIVTVSNSQIRQDVARWSKFEQLKAKYLSQDHPVSLQTRLLKHNLT